MTATNGKRELFLSERHRDELRASGIAHHIIAGRGYETIEAPTAADHSRQERLEKMGFPEWATKGNGCYPGMLIHQYSPTGIRSSAQYKPRVAVKDASGKSMKYASPIGKANRTGSRAGIDKIIQCGLQGGNSPCLDRTIRCCRRAL